MIRLQLTLPYPPSVNKIYAHGGRMRRSDAYESFRQGAKLRAFTQGARPLHGDVSIRMALFRPRRIGDIDAPVKGLLDALNLVAWLDDAQVVELHVLRFDDPADPRVSLTVEGKRYATEEERREAEEKRTPKPKGCRGLKSAVHRGAR